MKFLDESGLQKLLTNLKTLFNGKLDKTATAADSAKLGGKAASEYASAGQGTKADTADNTLGFYNFAGKGFTTLLQVIQEIYPTLAVGQSKTIAVAPATYQTLTDWDVNTTGSSATVLLTNVAGYVRAEITYGAAGSNKYRGGLFVRTTTNSAADWNGDWLRITPQLNYSEDEIQTGKRSIEGKMVYRRVFTGTITAAADDVVYSTLIASGIASLVRDDGWWVNGSDSNTKVSIHYQSPGGIFTAGVLVDGALKFQTKSSFVRTNAPYQVCVEYTRL